MENHLYHQTFDVDHDPYELFPFSELDWKLFLTIPYRVQSLILHTTYRSKIDGWKLSVEDEDLTIIMDSHHVFLKDEWEFTKF